LPEFLITKGVIMKKSLVSPLAAVLVAMLLAIARALLSPVKGYAERELVCWANHTGNEGVVHNGTTAIAELRSWEFNEEGNVIDDTILSDTWDTHKNGTNRWSGRCGAFWDETDTNGQEAINVGTKITLKFYPEGASSGDTYFVGTASPTRITRRATGANGMVECDFDFQGDGALSQTTV
jgi:hypothetical protein